ncbi:MAG: hypothetical protein FWC51_01140 [Proteobacteria bacterium]|nr:hypothetical protein [Pseudomonadota bacterium]
MKKIFSFAILCASMVVVAMSAYAVSLTAPVGIPVPTTPTVTAGAGGGQYVRGNAAMAAAFKQNQMNTYFMVTTPDVATACQTRIYACLSDYCGDVTVVPGQRDSRCVSASESELYNYVLLCLQKDTTALMPSFNVQPGAMNTAARLCPSYVQQGLMSYLSMANMADQLTKQRSDICVQRRRELEAAMSCHEVALANGTETSNKLTNDLTNTCGEGMPGGSAAMVQAFAGAGNVGANIWGWAEKIVSLDLNNKGADWQSAVDAILAGYVNRMNLACGDNLTLQTAVHPKDTGPTNLQIAAVMAVGQAFPVADETPDAASALKAAANKPKLWREIYSLTDIRDFATAKQVVQAGLSNPATTQNAFLTTSTMGDMQAAFVAGAKVFVLRDSARCYVVPVQTLTPTEQSVLAQQFASCKYN